MAGRYLKIYLGEGVKDKWVSLCQNKMLRRVTDYPDYSNKNRYGCSPQRFIINIICATLTKGSCRNFNVYCLLCYKCVIIHL